MGIELGAAFIRDGEAVVGRSPRRRCPRKLSDRRFSLTSSVATGWPSCHGSSVSARRRTDSSTPVGIAPGACRRAPRARGSLLVLPAQSHGAEVGRADLCAIKQWPSAGVASTRGNRHDSAVRPSVLRDHVVSPELLERHAPSPSTSSRAADRSGNPPSVGKRRRPIHRASTT